MANLNFPMCVPTFHRADMSPTSIQRAASDAGMAIDAQLVAAEHPQNDTMLMEGSVFQGPESLNWEERARELNEGEALDISVDDMEICI